MKKVMALLLTASLAFQTWSSNTALVHGASLPAETAVGAGETEDENHTDQADADTADGTEQWGSILSHRLDPLWRCMPVT